MVAAAGAKGNAKLTYQPDHSAVADQNLEKSWSGLLVSRAPIHLARESSRFSSCGGNGQLTADFWEEA